VRKHLKKLLIVSLILLAGCSKKTTNNDYIARVKDEYLLRQELAGMDSNFVRSYVDEWVNNNLLYVEAVERGYGTNDKIERMVNDFRKSLVINSFIQNEIISRAMKISDEEVMEFYQKHQDEFILDRPVVKIGYIKSLSRTDAVALRSKILKAKDFKTAVEDLSKEQGVAEVVTMQYFDQFNIPSAELWRVAWSLNKGEISFPVRAGDGYFLIYLYDKKEAGSKADFDLIVDDVRERAIVDKQNLLLDSLITELKRKYHYEVKW